MDNKETNDAIDNLNLPKRKEGESTSNYLKRLDEDGRFLFHGSPYAQIEILEPRKANDVGGDEWGNDTAVYAVAAVIAVGRAILPKREMIKGDWNIGSSRDPNRPGGPITTISSNITLSKGSVYIVDKQGFLPNKEGNEWKSKKQVKILAEVKVEPENYKEMGGVIKVLDE